MKIPSRRAGTSGCYRSRPRAVFDGAPCGAKLFADAAGTGTLQGRRGAAARYGVRFILSARLRWKSKRRPRLAEERTHVVDRRSAGDLPPLGNTEERRIRDAEIHRPEDETWEGPLTGANSVRKSKNQKCNRVNGLNLRQTGSSNSKKSI